MALHTLEDRTVDGVRVRLVIARSGLYALLYQSDDGLSAISHQTDDFSNALVLWRRSVALAERGFDHPAWKRKRQHKIEIAS